ncbi:MAG: mechanosensitive ion channel domain-containing protein [Sphingomonadales bacterium]
MAAQDTAQDTGSPDSAAEELELNVEGLPVGVTLRDARETFFRAFEWVEATVLSLATLLQIGLIVAGFAAAFLAVRWLGPLVNAAGRHVMIYPRIRPFFRPLMVPLVWYVMVALGHAVMVQFNQPIYLLRIASSLLMAWLVIRFFSNFIRVPELARLLAVLAWTVAALNIAGLLGPTVTFLDAAAISFGDVRISLLNVLQGVMTFVVVIWLALLVAHLLEQTLSRMPTLTPSAKVLLGKLARIMLITLAVLIGITSTGMDLTALAVFGGAIGLGIGFGLQKVVSNLFSGVILLMDRSIKPGDVIEVGDTYGWINKLAARYTSVITRDGREHLVPNEDMITMPVINWTYSSTHVRRHIPVGVAYGADLDLAMKLILEAADETERVLKNPDPKCLIKGFGDSAVELELRMWIGDPQNGVSNVASDVLYRIWTKFHEHGVEIPFPQRDLHVVSAPGLKELGLGGEGEPGPRPEKAP